MSYQHLNNPGLISVGLLLIRLVVGITFIGHSGQKLFGWFGGPGPIGFGKWLESLGFGSGTRIWSIIAGLFELAGGFLFAAGTLTPIGAILISLVMIDAILIVHMKNGFWIDKGGFEYNLVLIAVVIGVALTGPGSYILIHM
ncbi:DoxX family protein [Alicyclobacillus sp. SO9]|uniref:DoxX family protein n=1 Tax=Alicyclobacillus sp. SO9 TaxID=2665646 RepID=UPI0018E8CB26|nr:DoxX family protein [Alicyclobacillus sp. SO9]QQE80045.1 DoxX family protein [Alicyclobacillus sp. SO9]